MSAEFSGRVAIGRVARITGGAYVAFIGTSYLADVLSHIGLGEAADVYQALNADAGQFRLALVVSLVSAFLFLVTAWGLYVLLRSVNRDLAVLFLVLNAVGVAIQGASTLFLLTALLQGDASSQMQAYSAAQREGLAYLAINVYQLGFVTAQIFYATWLFPLGYLVFKSRLLPRALGALLVLDGVGILVWFVQDMLWPAYSAVAVPGLIVSLIAELGLGLWLLVKGVSGGAVETASESGPLLGQDA
jgi:hypothetical protein